MPERFKLIPFVKRAFVYEAFGIVCTELGINPVRASATTRKRIATEIIAAADSGHSNAKDIAAEAMKNLRGAGGT